MSNVLLRFIHFVSSVDNSFRWLLRWGPPLPIPNREVKPNSADGTGIPTGRVGRRPFYNPDFF